MKYLANVNYETGMYGDYPSIKEHTNLVNNNFPSVSKHTYGENSYIGYMRVEDIYEQNYAIVYGHLYKKYLCIEALGDGFTIEPTITIEYSRDSGKTWLTLPGGRSGSVAINTGEKMWIRSTSSSNINWSNGDGNWLWRNGATGGGMNIPFKVAGNIMSLYYGDDAILPTNQHNYSKLFANCSNLIDASELILPKPSVEYMFEEMFLNCTSLIKGATIQKGWSVYERRGVFKNMYKNCTSLEYAPVLVEEFIGNETVYSGIFNGCSSLKYIKNMIIQGITNCKNMFDNSIPHTGKYIISEDSIDAYVRGDFWNIIPDGWIVYYEDSEGVLHRIGIHHSIPNDEYYGDVPGGSGDNYYGYGSKYNNKFIRDKYPFDFYFEESNSQIFRLNNNTSSAKTIQYNILADTDKNTINNYKGLVYSYDGYIYEDIIDEFTFAIDPGKTVYLKGLFSSDFDWYYTDTTFEFNWSPTTISDLSIGGNILSLISKHADYFMNNVATSPTVIPLSASGQTSIVFHSYLSTPLSIKCANNIADNVYWTDNGSSNILSYRIIQGDLATGNIISTGSWMDCSSGLVSAINPNNIIQFHINNTTTPLTGGIGNIYTSLYQNTTAHLEIFGNIMSLLNPTVFETFTVCPNDYQFAKLFSKNDSIFYADKLILPATTLANYCYQYMFSAKSQLQTTPTRLPATTLANGCYFYMFGDCYSIRKSPKILAETTLNADSCCGCMFINCSNLTTLNIPYLKVIDSTACSNWIYSANNLNTIHRYRYVTYTTGTSGLPWQAGFIAYDYDNDYLTFNVLESGAQWGFKNENIHSLNDRYNILYSIDNGVTWYALRTTAEGEQTILSGTLYVPTGGKVIWKASLVGKLRTILGNFSDVTGVHYNISGNITSLLYGDNASNMGATLYDNYAFGMLFMNCKSLISAENLMLPSTTLTNNCYVGMFAYCTSLTTAPTLPATTLAMNCYNSMFTCCTSLTTAPSLPATILAQSCYNYMFNGCTSLTTAPTLPAVTLSPYCYQYMFYDCTNLTIAPSLSATTLASYCYGSMFYNCTGLTTAPELPATTLKDNCYASMFYGCTNLTTAPSLPATILAGNCYSYMFQNCTNLTTVSSLPATTLAPYCYNSMFYGCTNLTTVPSILPATILKDFCYSNMFSGCTRLTTAPALPATTLANYCYSSMFYDCTSLTTAPSILPATTLTLYCYEHMFRGCTSLTTAPVLPATTLASYCYQYMFYGCTSLTTASELPATILAQYCYQYMFYGCTSLTTAPALPATIVVNYSYSYMFSGCTSLNYVKCLAITKANIYNWLQNVAQTGVFVKHPSATWAYDSGGIPVGWTVLDYVGDTYDAEVEYIKSTGQQRCQLNYSPNPNTEFYLTLQFSNLDVGKTPTIMSTPPENDYTFAMNFGGLDNQTKTIFYWFYKAYQTSGSVIKSKAYSNVTVKTTMHYTNGTVSAFEDTTGFTVQNAAHNFTSQTILFGSATDNFALYDMTVWSMQIKENGVLVRNYIPVRVGTAGYLYDKVTNALCTNLTADPFVTGSDKT